MPGTIAKRQHAGHAPALILTATPDDNTATASALVPWAGVYACARVPTRGVEGYVSLALHQTREWV